MAVYVDSAENGLGRMKMCHMWADTAEELHAMASAIGMSRAWYQTPDGPNGSRASFPHYDVAKGRRVRAIELGAIPVSRMEGYHSRKAIRQRIIDEPTFAASWRYANRGPND